MLATIKVENVQESNGVPIQMDRLPATGVYVMVTKIVLGDEDVDDGFVSAINPMPMTG